MTLSDIASIGSLVSGVAVLASLVYLSQQTRQAAANQRAALHQGRAVSAMSFFALFAESKSLESFVRGAAGDQQLSVMDFQRYRSWFAGAMIADEDIFYQHRSKMIGDDRYFSTVVALREMFQQPGNRVLWQVSGKHAFEKEFIAFVEGIIADGRALKQQDILADWKAGLASEMGNVAGVTVD